VIVHCATGRGDVGAAGHLLEAARRAGRPHLVYISIVGIDRIPFGYYKATGAALVGHQPGHLGRAAVGAVALACFYLVLAVIRPGGLGLGDVKLAASAGAVLGWIGWQALLSGTFAAFALAGVYGGALLALHRATRTSHLPLGPFILVGTLAAIAL
jgi:prepilin signal peptidase PulO-like enzyme (type II secretory pathway)